MFDSTLTDEFYVAVTEFNLSWEEVLTLGTNSLQYSFLQPDIKTQQLALYHQQVAEFETQVASDTVPTQTPAFRAFICKFEHELCSGDKD